MSPIFKGIIDSQFVTTGLSPFIGISSSGSLYGNGNACISGTKIVLSNLDGGNTNRYVMYTDNGTISWQKQIAMQNPIYVSASEFSPNGNVVTIGDSQGQTYGHLEIWSSSGTEVAQKQYTTGSGTMFQNLAIDASNNIFGAGTADASQRALVTKFNSSGTVQWSSNYTVVNYSGGYSDIDLDSSGNVYAAGYIEGGYQGIVAKLNSSGTAQWYANIRGASTPSSAEANFAGVAVSSTGDVYAGGGWSSSGGSNRKPTLFKYNSSGTLQWQREFAYNTSANTYYSDVVVGADGYIYGVWGNYVAKYDSSGTLQWQRKFTSATVVFGSIRISGTNMILGGKIAGYDAVFVLPTDGTKTGTYTVSGNTVIYGAGTGTEQSGNALTTAASISAGTSTLTTTSPGRGISNTTFTFTKVSI